MSQIYTNTHRQLQQQYGTEALADAIEAAAVNEALQPDQSEFIARQIMFFLSSIDEQGRPTVSYKGGTAGFVKVLNNRQLMFPSYDGNGMFYSMGNIAANPQVGLLFVDFQTPNRLRAQGRASLVDAGPELAAYPGADLVVKLDIEQVWVNCARYVHQFSLTEASPYVPATDGSAPVAMWKRIEGMAALLSPEDQSLVESAGTITAVEYATKLAQGEVI
ncbi:MAG: pyridoxamine 5'-phosphate oxidase family protein [Pseudomonadota bacterium]